ncbi:MAG: acetylxylan esterase [Planctomycetaceae bacterium]|nr:acetylxylan esterase [Planctomycetaceae bacterium]
MSLKISLLRKCLPQCGLLWIVLISAVGVVRADEFEPNYDESKVPAHVLPDPLIRLDGTPVADAEAWRTLRRPELLTLFSEQVYGKAPGKPDQQHFEILDDEPQALEGLATRRQVRVYLTAGTEGPAIDLLIYIPNMGRPVPVFLGLNFYGNHTVAPDPNIRLNTRWMRNGGAGVVDNRSTDAARGSNASRWPVEMILQRGYALATAYYGDIDPDYDDGFKNGVHAVFDVQVTGPLAADAPRPGDAWGSIAAWAWGLSRCLDYLATDQDVDATRVSVIGHSRLGKTSLWAGATDERFALVISNNSGCGGAALSRRAYGETIGRINTVFPHWFCDNFNQYNNDEAALPVDQHELVALIAPRPVYIASAVDDRWADPLGEYLSAFHASPVYKLLGTPGLPRDSAELSPVDEPVKSGSIGYHLRTGKHDVTDFDWQQYLDFADLHLRPK